MSTPLEALKAEYADLQAQCSEIWRRKTEAHRRCETDLAPVVKRIREVEDALDGAIS